MKRHGNPNTIIQHLTYENHMLRTKYNEILSILTELQKEIENKTGVLKLLQDKNTELNRELIKKNKQIATILNNPPEDDGNIITDMLLNQI